MVETVTHVANQAVSFIRLCTQWERSVGAENHIKSITLYPPAATRNGMWLVVAKAYSGGYKMVAFHRAGDPLSALVGFLSRVEQQKIEWKKDTWGEGA